MEKLPSIKHKSKMLQFLCQIIAELTVEFVFYGTLLSCCRLMSANVSGLVNLCITYNDTEVEIAYYIAVSHNHYFPINVLGVVLGKLPVPGRPTCLD